VRTLDQLASDWLAPTSEEHFALPAITNFHGMVQAAWDISGVQNWICAPTGLSTPTALMFHRDGDRIRRFPRTGIQYRWKAYEIERRGHGVHSVVRMPAGQAAVIERIRFERDLHMYLVFTGLPRVWRFTDYWNLPPEDVPQMNLRLLPGGFLLSDVKTFGWAAFRVPGRLSVYSDLQAWLDGEPPVKRGRVGVAELRVKAGQPVVWEAQQGCEGLPWFVATPVADDASQLADASIPYKELTYGSVDEASSELPAQDPEWSSAQTTWEHVWQSAFTPGNTEFSGHLPTYEDIAGPMGKPSLPVHGRTSSADPIPDLSRLYYVSVLTLLMTRRIIPPPTPRSQIATGGQCIWSEPTGGASEPEAQARASPSTRLERAYVWGGPEGAPTTSFLWEVEFQAPLLARLDPVVLRNQLEAMLRVDLRGHWGIETISGAGAGMAYGVNPGAFLSCVRDYVRNTGDREWALRRLDYLKSCLRPELTDYGDCQNILECVSTYEHTVAAFNALAVQGLRFVAELTGDTRYARQADGLARQVLTLYAGGPWACLQPDGSRRVVKTILDFVYVGRCMTADLPDDVKRGMVEFFERELQTDDWLYALSPNDPDALTKRLPAFQTYRADHQATGSYDGWPARAASVLLRFGCREKALAWLRRIQELTREGPFGQAHYIHAQDSREAVDRGFPSRTRKASFFNGNCYFESAGCGFATTLLEDLAGRPRSEPTNG